MRIVSGKYKGRRFSPPKNFRARPTTDTAKESLFNVLNNFIDWEETRSLDLFGGTGSISFELVSRGCPQVLCVEKDYNHVAFIEKTRKELDAQELMIFKADVFKYLENCSQKFDLIFADPPYDMKNLEKVPQIIIEKEMLNQDGIFILEHSKDFDFSTLLHFSEKRVYGSVNFSMFRP